MYVDGYVIPVASRKLSAYRRVARKAGRIWREHGALEYRECLGDDLKPKGFTPFPSGIGARPGETILFSWVVFRSKAHRNRVNAKVLADPRIQSLDPGASIFDCKRMLYGGFRMIVDV